jgi:hypothetical protein
MRGTAFIFVSVVAALVALAMSFTTYRPVQADCLDPDAPDWVAWDTTREQRTNASCVGTVAKFSREQRLHWCYTSAPTTGAFEYVDVDNDNVTGVTYEPAYFFPTSNAGSVLVKWKGELNDSRLDGSIQTKGWCWPPYAEAFRTVTVNKPPSPCT